MGVRLDRFPLGRPLLFVRVRLVLRRADCLGLRRVDWSRGRRRLGRALVRPNFSGHRLGFGDYGRFGRRLRDSRIGQFLYDIWNSLSCHAAHGILGSLLRRFAESRRSDGRDEIRGRPGRVEDQVQQSRPAALDRLLERRLELGVG